MVEEEENNNFKSKDFVENGCSQRTFIGLLISDVKQTTTTQEYHVEFYSTEDLELEEVIVIIDEHHESIVYGIVDEIFMFEDVPTYIQKWMEYNSDFEAEVVIQRPILAFAIEIMVPSNIFKRAWIKTALHAGQIWEV